MTERPEPRDAHTVRVASYNVRAFKDDREALVEVVRRIDPDVLLLQEAPRHPGSGHRVAAFAEQVGLTWADGRRGRMSTTLLSSLRLDLLSCEHRNLPVGRREEPRGYAVARLRLPGHLPFTAVSVHLSLRSAQRGPHVQQILRDIDAIGAAAAVLGGDLNETYGEGAWRDLAVRMREVTGDVLTSPSGTPGKTIDGLLISGPVGATVPRLDLDPLQLRMATDHRPVYVDMDLTALAEPHEL
ncbi:endonuclease/exonuclease/phosphatase family protein [Allobranchiibius huperziae]|uniref:Endonuclease/exonuclease/phosphatase family metal-dependent hydrolase n=1 Tax=Allobranchiibius huperziae TaxID=1874116 RepID=A0A853DGF2_9MICO|nr:endonuclease/exonuclease/phosphatase family protein [Allobranchiibius huperziae]NYJ75039.1 endonuclease/exonuclease/phosphatase family metal-dependent hydrolase [Allobranchiibius huperziae]